MRAAIDKWAGSNAFESVCANTHARVPLKLKTDRENQLLAATVNTSALLLSIIDSLATRVSSLITTDLRSVIGVEDAKEAIGGELRQQLVFIVDAVVKECEPGLIQIVTGNGDPSVADAIAEIRALKSAIETSTESFDEVLREREAAREELDEATRRLAQAGEELAGMIREPERVEEGKDGGILNFVVAVSPLVIVSCAWLWRRFWSR
jgi:hypothetical protein